MMIPEITIKISFTQPGGERSEPTVRSVDVAPPALPANGVDQIPPVPSAEDGGAAAQEIPPLPAPDEEFADDGIPPLPPAVDGASEGEPPEPPPAGPKARRGRTE